MRFVTNVGRPKCRSGRLPNGSARGQPRMDGFTRIHSLGPLVCCALGPIPALGSSRAGEPRMDTKGHEWRRLGCSRGRPPRIVLKPGRLKADSIALPTHGETWDSSFEPAAQSGISSARFLTADGADGETVVGLSDLPALLFQAMGFLMCSGVAPRGGNHGWTRIDTDKWGSFVAGVRRPRTMPANVPPTCPPSGSSIGFANEKGPAKEEGCS